MNPDKCGDICDRQDSTACYFYGMYEKNECLSLKGPRDYSYCVLFPEQSNVYMSDEEIANVFCLIFYKDMKKCPVMSLAVEA